VHVSEITPVLIHRTPSSILLLLLVLGLDIGALGLWSRFIAGVAPSDRVIISVVALGFALAFEPISVSVLDGVHIEGAFKTHVDSSRFLVFAVIEFFL